MSTTSLLQDIFEDKRQRASVKIVGSALTASMYRSFVVDIVNTQPPFKYGFICTKSGIEEVSDVDQLSPTVKVVCTFEVLNAILTKKITFQQAIYNGFVQIYGDQPQLHINILVTFFGDLV